MIHSSLQTLTTPPVVVSFKRGKPVFESITRATVARLHALVTRQQTPGLVRYTLTSKRAPKRLAPTLRLVYEALARGGISGFSTPELVARIHGKMAPNTARWAVQVLRQRGLVRTVAP